MSVHIIYRFYIKKEVLLLQIERFMSLLASHAHMYDKKW